MTAQTSIKAADLRVGDRLVWPGKSAYNVAADIVEPVLSVRTGPPPDNRIYEVVTRRNTTNRTRLLGADYPCHVLLPRPADEATP